VSKFALWWVRWNGSDCESRMTVGGRKATVEDFKERDFEGIVVLGGEGRGIKSQRKSRNTTLTPRQALGRGYKDLAHYFSVDLEVIDEMNSFSRKFGESYV